MNEKNIIIKLYSFIPPQIPPLGGRTSLCLATQRMPAVTDGVHAFIYFYNLAIVSVTAGTVCPVANI